MKWIALALIVISAGVLTAWLRTNPRRAPFVWGLLGFLPFVLGPWHLIIAPYSTPMWSGYVKGWEISVLDAVAVAVVLGTRGRWPRMVLLTPFLAYLIVVALAVWQAKFGALAASYPIQLCRVFLVFLAVARVTVDERGERAVLTGLILGLVVQAGYAIWARAGGALQTGGSLGHQNLLGFVSHLALLPAFAMFLAGRFRRAALVGVFAGLAVVILTASRATIAFSAIGLVLTLLFSLTLHFSPRKVIVGVVGFLVLLGSFPLANAALERRFQVQGHTFFTEDREREAFERAAHAIIAANPMGIGPNHYVFIANTEGYSARAGVNWMTGSRSTSVHNSYLLVTAETGFFGLIAFLILLGCAMWQAFRTAIRYRREQAAEVLVGVGCGLVAMSLHALYEWMFVVYPAQYVLAAGLGLVVGIRGRFLGARKIDRASTLPPRMGASPISAGAFPSAVPLAPTDRLFGDRA